MRRWMRTSVPTWILAAWLCATALGGQQQTASGVRLPDDQAIEAGISEMLAGWQIGDVDLMHRHYANDVMVVSGVYEPPIIGWDNYLKAYQAQRQRIQSVRLDRSNTYTKIQGNFAWCTYQWEFSAMEGGQPTGARGQATLILEKRGDRWLIVHNHTSVVSLARAQPPQQVPQSPGSPGL